MIVMGMVVMAVSCVAVRLIIVPVQGNGARRGRGDRGMGVVVAIVVVRMRRVVVSVAGGMRVAVAMGVAVRMGMRGRQAVRRPAGEAGRSSSGPAFFHSSQAPKAEISA